MCVVSMVYDYYAPKFHWTPDDFTLRPYTHLDFEETKRKFLEALEAARKVDKLTDQPDCVDPEKAKLDLRLAELERQVKDLKDAARKKTPKKRAKRRRKP